MCHALYWPGAVTVNQWRDAGKCIVTFGQSQAICLPISRLGASFIKYVLDLYLKLFLRLFLTVCLHSFQKRC